MEMESDQNNNKLPGYPDNKLLLLYKIMDGKHNPFSLSRMCIAIMTKTQKLNSHPRKDIVRSIEKFFAP